MKTILFCRVSSKEQEETGYSLSAQEKLLTEYANKKEFEIAKIFSISESASGHKQREIFNEMISYVQRENIKIIICEKADRLTRNFKDMVKIDEWLEKDELRELHLVKDSLALTKGSKSQEKLNWGIRILFAKNYIDNLSEEVRKGQKEKLAQGWLPTSPPIGYKTVGETGHRTYVIDEIKMPLVKKMFELYATRNYSLKKLTYIMNEAGLRNNKGNVIVKSRIHQFLTDPFYIGKNRWNGVLHRGEQETFISNELFDKVHEILKSKTTPKYAKHNFLFKSLFRCMDCKGTITWETHKGHIYGHCNHYKACSQKKWFIESEIEKQIIQGFDKLSLKSPRLVEWIRKALKETHKDTIEYYTTSLDELNKHLKLIEQRFEKIYDDKIDGKITEEFYNKKFKQYDEEKDKVSKAIKTHAHTSTRYFELAMNVYDLSQRAKEIYEGTKEIDSKRQLLRLVYENLSVKDGKIFYTYTKAFKLLYLAVEATNGTKFDSVVKTDKRIFERKESYVYMGQYDGFYVYRPVLLPD
jgi:site-specific DNA recombinase